MYWYWFSSFIYVYINFQPCLGSAACAGKRSGPSTPHCSDGWQRHPKAGSKHREHKWHFSAQISKALVPAVGVEGRMQVADWGIFACSIFRGTCIQIPLSLTALEIHCHTSRFGFGPLFCIGPTFFGRKKPLLWDIRAEWCYLMKQREVGSSKMYFNSTSVSWVHEQSLPSAKLFQASIFWTQCARTLKAPTNASSPAPFSFLHVLQAETDGNLKLLDSAPGSCWHLWLLTRQLHSAKQPSARILICNPRRGF